MTQRKTEEPKNKTGPKKLTLSKETLRDLKGRNHETQQVKGGRNCSGTDSGCGGG